MAESANLFGEESVMTAEGTGTAFSVGSGLASVIGAYYSVKALQYQAASQMSRLRFQRSQAFRRGRIAELAARETSEAGQRRGAQVGMQYAQLIGAQDARGSASGTQAGVGSRRDVSAATEWAKDTALETVTKNTADAVAGLYVQRGGAEAQGSLLGGQAAGVAAQRGALNPGMSMFAAALQGTAGVVNSMSRGQLFAPNAQQNTAGGYSAQNTVV